MHTHTPAAIVLDVRGEPLKPYDMRNDERNEMEDLKNVRMRLTTTDENGVVQFQRHLFRIMRCE